MKKSELRRIIKEEIKKLRENNMNLKIGTEYDVLEPGLNQYHTLEYLGFDTGENHHIFWALANPISTDLYVLTVPNGEEQDMIKSL